ncbi:hypothetical protein D5274_14915 [bacterium 1XD42-94]|nr:hypothetical protein [bacterium 1XD42-76]NBK06397.1 hypothetical protein [bacterium 1XD42-94]
MNTMLMRFLLCLPAIIFLLLVIGSVAFCVWYFKAFYAERAERQKKSEEQRKRNGGECILEWAGSLPDGAPDAEFGKLVVEIPQKRGGGVARFYKKGLVLEQKRLPYSEIKDVLCVEAVPGAKHTAKQAVRDMGVLWIYPKKGATIGLREMSYHFDNEIMNQIKRGLGF